MSGAAPVKVGVLIDHVGPESPMVGEVRRVLDQATADGRLDRPVELVVEVADGLPRGTAAAVSHAFSRLVDQDVVAILGPSITDNGLVVRDLADDARMPCCNWTGSDRTRSEWMFHYQIGSLEEEPFLLADHLVARGCRRLVVVQDRSPIGARYGAYLDRAVEHRGLRVDATSFVSPVADDLTATVEEIRRHDADGLVYLGLGLSAGALGRAIAASGWQPPAVATNSALMFGWANPDWTALWEGWTYVDAWSERNPRLEALLDLDPSRRDRSPLMFAAGDDLGRLLTEALAGAELFTPAAVKESWERVKCLPASLGGPDTTMSFGQWDRAALKGEFLVLRTWRGGRSLPVDR